MAAIIQDLPGEIWKPVPGYEGLYSVSAHGRIRSEARTVPYKGGTPRRLASVILRPNDNGIGHGWVGLRKDGRTHKLYVHRAVLEAFVGPCPEGMECCHNDGNPQNNRVENLRWGTRQDNVDDQSLHGVTSRGERNGHARLSAEDVRAIREAYSQGIQQPELARRYGVAQTTISHVVLRETWRHVN